jgi:hypothetical protein
MKFRSGINVTSYGPGFQPVGGAGGATGDPRLSNLN